MGIITGEKTKIIVSAEGIDNLKDDPQWERDRRFSERCGKDLGFAGCSWAGLSSFWIAALSRHHTFRFVALCSKTKKFVALFFLTTRSPVGFIFSIYSRNGMKIWKLVSLKLCKPIKLTQNGLSCPNRLFPSFHNDPLSIRDFDSLESLP